MLLLDYSTYNVLSQDVLLIITSAVSLYLNLIFLPSNIIAFMSKKHRYCTAIV